MRSSECDTSRRCRIHPAILSGSLKQWDKVLLPLTIEPNDQSRSRSGHRTNFRRVVTTKLGRLAGADCISGLRPPGNLPASPWHSGGVLILRVSQV